MPDKLMTVASCYLEHLWVCCCYLVTNRSGVQSIQRINRDDPGATPSRFGIEVRCTVSAIENSRLEIRVAQSEYAPIFLEGPAPRNYLIACDTLSRVPATNHIY